jgi:hypothetical protein
VRDGKEYSREKMSILVKLDKNKFKYYKILYEVSRNSDYYSYYDGLYSPLVIDVNKHRYHTKGEYICYNKNNFTDENIYMDENVRKRARKQINDFLQNDIHVCNMIVEYIWSDTYRKNYINWIDLSPQQNTILNELFPKVLQICKEVM